MKMPERQLINWGLWDVDNIGVHYIGRNWVRFSIRLNRPDGETRITNVYYTPLDWIRGVDFDEKVKQRLEKFKRKYIKKNEEILELRRKQKRLLDGR